MANRELSNTYGLPRGEPIRRELVRVFKAQRKAILGFIRTGRKDDYGRDVTGDLPEWGDFGFGSLKMSERFTPLIRAYWKDGGRKLYTRVGLDPDEWSVVNPHTEAMIQQAALDFCEATNKTTSLDLATALQKTRDELTQGIVTRGEALPVLTKRINEIFDGAEKWRARRIAASEASRAVHAAGEQAAIESGVVTGWEWLLSSDACPLCQTVGRRAKYVKLGQPFAVVGDNPTYSVVRFPPLHPNCLLPETPILAPGRIAGIEVHYDGPVVRLEFSDGSKFTVTPNHMLLTPTGFARAKSLSEFDKVIRCKTSDCVSLDSPDNNKRPPRVDDVVRAISISRGMTTIRVPVSPEYIHGDAIFCKGEINVVTAYSELSDDGNSSIGHKVEKDLLVNTHCGRIGCSCDSQLAKALDALRLATDSGVRSVRESQADLWCSTAHPEALGFGHASESDSGLNQSSADSLPAYAERLRDCLLGLTGTVSTCHVTKVESSHYVGPVYDVQTTSTLYALDHGIVSSNCQCTVVEVIDIDEQPQWAETLVQPKPEPEDLPEDEKSWKPKRRKPSPLPVKTFKYRLKLTDAPDASTSPSPSTPSSMTWPSRSSGARHAAMHRSVFLAGPTSSTAKSSRP